MTVVLFSIIPCLSTSKSIHKYLYSYLTFLSHRKNLFHIIFLMFVFSGFVVFIFLLRTFIYLLWLTWYLNTCLSNVIIRWTHTLLHIEACIASVLIQQVKHEALNVFVNKIYVFIVVCNILCYCMVTTLNFEIVNGFDRLSL